MVAQAGYTPSKLGLRGPNAWLYDVPFMRKRDGEAYLYDEVLLWSKRGTGKSFATGDTLLRWAIDYPGSRFLVLRSTLTRLKLTWQTTFERHILPAYGLTKGQVYRASEHKYVIGDSELVMGGMDDPERYRSFEGNAALFVESTEFSREQYEGVIGSLRWSKGLPWHGRISECNPTNPFNQVHARFIGGEENWHKRQHEQEPGRVAWRLATEDNPHYYDEGGNLTVAGARYMQTLEAYTGVDYDRMVRALWRAAQGAVFGDVDLPSCLLTGAELKKIDGYWTVTFPLDDEREPIKLGWFSAGFDYGHTNPTSFTVWGHEAGGDRKVLVAEVYKTGLNEDGLMKAVVPLEQKWGIWRGVGDPAAASPMSAINKRITRTDGRPFLVSADKQSATAGSKAWAQTMHMHAELSHGNVLYMPHTLTHDPDPELVARGAPTCAFEELPGLMWAPPTQSKKFEIVGGPPPVDEVIKKDDHGFDGTRYMLWALRGKDLTPPPKQVNPMGAGDYGWTEAVLNDPIFQDIMDERGD